MKSRVTITLTWHMLAAGSLIMLLCLVCMVAVGYKLYEKVLATETKQKALFALQEENRVRKEEEAGKMILEQRDELSRTKTELEQAKKETLKTTAQIKTLAKAIEDKDTPLREAVISSNDLAPYVTGVVQVLCSNASGLTSGSGSLFIFDEVGQAVLTNHHVVEGATKCVAHITNTANSPIGIFAMSGSIYTYNHDTDEAILAVGNSLSTSNVPAANYNYSISSLRRCSSLMPVGTPIVIVGFPAYAKRDSTVTIETLGTVNAIYRTVTNGIISGYDTSSAGDANYFVSAKIDNGNSGGIALAKDDRGLCALGLPTWLSVGNYETQGLVQNIANLLPKN
jgi:S1-C subfamily serine protease